MKGRKALITGGTGDIGTTICKEFIDMGAKVIAVDIDEKKAQEWQKQQKAKGYDIAFAEVDVTSFDSCKNMAADVEKNFGVIDILVNAAGTINDSTLRNMTSEQWNSVVHTDLDSLFNVTKQFVEGMIKNKYGRIINIASVSGEKGQYGQINYASAKAGIYGFTKSLAQELAKHGITVNAISPGFVNSRMVKTIPEKILNNIIQQTPAGRLATPEEIAWAIAFLASERSAFITGVDLSVNGGFYMH